VPASRRPVTGRERVAQVVLAGREWYPEATARLVTVNGAPGVLLTRRGEVIAITGLTVAGGLITEIDAIVNPEKLRASQALAGG